MCRLRFCCIQYHIPEVEFEDSAGILDANANNVEKYNAQITLSAASPAVKTEGETWRASEIAT